ncbi:hypothetical protein DCAR_0727464 [Daucus carota subsp. sativus]|uniref:Uncharacterized protein n=1 Tax=Daucus carota subsp. sativus TaxID=79200 RepID=A0A164SXZ8_DAUCS|nr:hypothetical protein DCAR_0727464 [Daucus carota subsp. sativus]
MHHHYDYKYWFGNIKVVGHPQPPLSLGSGGGFYLPANAKQDQAKVEIHSVDDEFKHLVSEASLKKPFATIV